MSENQKGENAAIVFWSTGLLAWGVTIIVGQLVVEDVLRFMYPWQEPPPTIPIGFVVLIAGAILLAYGTHHATVPPGGSREKLDPAKALIAAGVGIAAIQLVLEYELRFMHLSRDPPIFPVGLVVLAVGVILLALTTYGAKAKPDTGRQESDPA